MSGLSDYNNAVSAFNSGSEGIKQYASQTGDKFFSDWKTKISDNLQLDDEKKEQLENVMTAGSIAFPIVAPAAAKSLNFLKGKIVSKAKSYVANKAASLDEAVGKVQSAAQDASNDVGAVVQRAKGTVANAQEQAQAVASKAKGQAEGAVSNVKGQAEGAVSNVKGQAEGAVSKAQGTVADIPEKPGFGYKASTPEEGGQEMSNLANKSAERDLFGDGGMPETTSATVGGGENVSSGEFASTLAEKSPGQSLFGPGGYQTGDPEKDLFGQGGVPEDPVPEQAAVGPSEAAAADPLGNPSELPNVPESDGGVPSESVPDEPISPGEISGGVTEDAESATQTVSKLGGGAADLIEGTETAEAAAPELSEFILPAAAIAGVGMEIASFFKGPGNSGPTHLVATATGLSDSITKGGYAMAGKNSVTTLPASNSAF